ncbi:MAG: hypothetical protein WA742_14880, partial [Candidatus Cybelea sp.]
HKSCSSGPQIDVRPGMYNVSFGDTRHDARVPGFLPQAVEANAKCITRCVAVGFRPEIERQ